MSQDGIFQQMFGSVCSTMCMSGRMALGIPSVPSFLHAVEGVGDNLGHGETTENFCERLGKSLCQMVLGLVMIPGCMGLIFWNENNLVVNEATADLVSGAKVYPTCVPSPKATGELVLVACDLYAPDIASSLPNTLSPFLDHVSAASISWTMEIFQWKEDEEDDCEDADNGGQKCTKKYSYSRSWVEAPVDSASFAHPDGHDNCAAEFPSNLESSGSVEAPPQSVVMSEHGTPSGGFVLDSGLVSSLPSVDLGNRLKSSAPSSGGDPTWDGSGQLTAQMLHGNGEYLLTTTGFPQIGDLRIQFAGQLAQEATVCAVQQSTEGASSEYTFEALPPRRFGWFGEKTKPLERLEAVKVSQDEFIEHYHEENQGDAWTMRLFALGLMSAALHMVLSPLSVAAEGFTFLNKWLCGLGRVLKDAAQCVVGTAAVLIALILTTLTIALAWFTVRPVSSLAAVAVALCLKVLFVKFHHKKNQRKDDDYFKLKA
mmetsp:Transcript_9615/g.20463  ORF Transcript_9615/g.20463 Transcript_9615/m.20463 type:complete len:485 (-) Transcript_9615:53-1507(-)